MNLLLDMNIPTTWRAFLLDAGHEAVHWRSIGDIRAEDTEIMKWTGENGYTVFTNDLDFGSLLYSTNAEGPSVIQLRAEHIVPEVLGTAVLQAIELVEQDLYRGALVTIDPRRHRVRLLPLRDR